MLRTGKRMTVWAVLVLASAGCQSTGVSGLGQSLAEKIGLKSRPAETPPLQVPDKLSHERELTLKYADWMLEIGKLKEASEKYNLLLEKNPKDVHAIIGLARIDEEAGMDEKALKGYQRAIELEPDSAFTQSALGRYHASRKNWAGAVDAYNRAVLADPLEFSIRGELAKALVHQGQIEAAMPHFIRTQGEAEAHYQTAVILQENGKLEEAEQQLRIALSKKPDLVEASIALANVTRANSRSMHSAQEESDEVVPASHSQSVPNGSRARAEMKSRGSQSGSHSTASGFSIAGHQQ